LEIADWLRGLSLDRYAETLPDNAVDAAVLPELSEVHLEKLGVLLDSALRRGAAEHVAEPATRVGDVATMRTRRCIAIRYDELP
jgi:hypothetical protein